MSNDNYQLSMLHTMDQGKICPWKHILAFLSSKSLVTTPSGVLYKDVNSFILVNFEKVGSAPLQKPVICFHMEIEECLKCREETGGGKNWSLGDSYFNREMVKSMGPIPIWTILSGIKGSMNFVFVRRLKDVWSVQKKQEGVRIDLWEILTSVEKGREVWDLS